MEKRSFSRHQLSLWTNLIIYLHLSIISTNINSRLSPKPCICTRNQFNKNLLVKKSLKMYKIGITLTNKVFCSLQKVLMLASKRFRARINSKRMTPLKKTVNRRKILNKDSLQPLLPITYLDLLLLFITRCLLLWEVLRFLS